MVYWRQPTLDLALKTDRNIQVADYATDIRANTQLDAAGGGFAFVEQSPRAGTQTVQSQF
jgi:hypothetical protein